MTVVGRSSRRSTRRRFWLAGLCLVYCCRLAYADDERSRLHEVGKGETGDSAAGGREKRAVSETRPANRDEEQWDQAVNSFWRTLAYRDLEDVATVVMKKLWWHLFGSCDAQKAAWWKLRNSYRNYLREWCLTTPLVPVETLKMGLWYALSKLVADDLAAVIGGTPQYERAKELLSDASVVSGWAKEIGKRLMEGGLQRWVQQSSYTRWSGWEPSCLLDESREYGREWTGPKRGYRKHGLGRWGGPTGWDPRGRPRDRSTRGSQWHLGGPWEDDVKGAIDAWTRGGPGYSMREPWRRTGDSGWGKKWEEGRQREWRP